MADEPDNQVVEVATDQHKTTDSLPVSRIQPGYQQVADQLFELILTGALSSGDRLPTEAELAGTFGVSRSTVRDAHKTPIFNSSA